MSNSAGPNVGANPPIKIVSDSFSVWLKRKWSNIGLVLLIAAVIITGLSLMIAQMPYSGSRVGIVGASGLVLTGFGLVLALAGFAATLHQLDRTIGSVEAATAETERIRSSLAAYDAVQQASRADYALLATQRHFESKAFRYGSESYSDCRVALISIRETVDGLDPDIVDGIDQADEYISKLCIRIDKGLDKVEPKHMAELRSHRDLLNKIKSHIHRKAV